MKSLSALLAFTLICSFAAQANAAPTPDPAFAAACQSQMKPGSFSLTAIEFKELAPVQEPLSAINRQSRRTSDITKVAASAYTLAKMQLNMSFDQSYLYDAKNHLYCSSAQAHVNMGYDPVVVKIADMYPAGSCSYNAILEHEQGHVAIFSQGVSADRVKSLQDTLNTQAPHDIVYSSTLDEGNELLKAKLKAYQAQFDGYYAAINALQMGHDSDEESERVLNTCNGELKAILKRAVNTYASLHRN